MRTSRFLRGLLVAFVGVLAGRAAMPLEPGSNQGTVEFVASTDAHRAVLFVAVMSPQTGVNRSMTLYGDGRLVLAELVTSRKVIREREFQLTLEESRDLVELAIDHRLAEYDETDVRARELRGKTTTGAEGVLDATTTILRIALDSYSREGHVAEDLEKEIQVYAVKQAARNFPDIIEFQGLKALQDRLYQYWRSTGWPLW